MPVASVAFDTLPGDLLASGIQITTITLGVVTISTVPLTWTAAIGGAGPYTYQVQAALGASPSSGAWSNVGAPISGLSLTVTGLTRHTVYAFRVIATDSAAHSGVSPIVVQQTAGLAARLLALLADE